MHIAGDITATIGNTPLAELKNIEKKYALKAKLFAKCEFMNPVGSAKDRIAMNMIARAEESGLLPPGGTVIEPTSGNTGIGIAAICAAKGYKAVIIMPDTMSIERCRLIKAFGAELILTGGKLGMNAAVAKAEEMKNTIPGSIIAGQFVNPANPEAHYLTTGPEIWRDTEGNVDILVSGVGSGGTISGTGRFLKEKNENVRVVAVEPFESPLLSEGKAGPHGMTLLGPRPTSTMMPPLRAISTVCVSAASAPVISYTQSTPRPPVRRIISSATLHSRLLNTAVAPSSRAFSSRFSITSHM